MTNYQYIQVIFIAGVLLFFGGGWFWFYRFLICIYLLTCSFFILLVLPVLGRGVLIRDRVNDIEISLISKKHYPIKKTTTTIPDVYPLINTNGMLKRRKGFGFLRVVVFANGFLLFPNNPCLTRELTSTLFSC